MAEAFSDSFVQRSISIGSRPRRLAEEATSRVPMNANATPTEQTMRYFHMASRDSGVTCTQIRKAVSRVVASMPTHMTPMLFESRTRLSAASAPHHRPPNCRALPRSKPCRDSST